MTKFVKISASHYPKTIIFSDVEKEEVERSDSSMPSYVKIGNLINTDRKISPALLDQKSKKVIEIL